MSTDNNDETRNPSRRRFLQSSAMAGAGLIAGAGAARAATPTR